MKGRRRSTANNTNPSHRTSSSQLGGHVRGRQLECLILERLPVPEQVVEFGQFEELSKLYAIEQPFVPRTQLELHFDCYDGAKLRHFGSMDDEAGEGEDDGGVGGSPSFGYSQQGNPAAPGQQQSVAEAEQQQHRRRVAIKNKRPLSWCRLHWFGRHTGHHKQSSIACCLSTSDTTQELGRLLSSSSTSQTIHEHQQKSTSSPRDPIQWALQPSADDEPGEAELKAEALRLIGRMTRGASTVGGGGVGVASALQDQSPGGASQLAQLDQSLDLQTNGRVSICLLDKRHLPRQIELDGSVGNGRRWARVSSKLLQLSRKLRSSRAKQQPSKRNKEATQASEAGQQKLVEKISRKVSRRFARQVKKSNELVEPEFVGRETYDEQTIATGAHQQATGIKRGRKIPQELRLDKESLAELVELVKTSVNQLIDAQLLFRNKLTGEQSSACLATFRSSEYETLLRNNFNLLKIWQNLEETKRLVCFVCEPIKCNLADLFWFNRFRSDWPTAQAFNANLDGLGGGGGGGGSQSRLPAATTNLDSSSSNSFMFLSPLVNLDAIQVKRGLLQILEALNFLHVICKLVHRNLTPKNILIASDDNWKLSGLEFAIRFESTTISESASVMAHEITNTQTILRYSKAPTSAHSSASASGSSGHQLRRQRTLHQTMCQEFQRRHKCLLLQPDLNYLAPEIWKSSKCSHKSDIFSFGLIVGQTYDLCRHKSPIECKLNAQNYDSELKKLNERRKTKLSQLVPCEMGPSLLEMLECEPNLRPSANYILQLLKRPVELCKVNEDSLRHLKASLGYLETRLVPAAGSSARGSGGAQIGHHQATNASENQQQHTSPPSAANTTTTGATNNANLVSAANPNSICTISTPAKAPGNSGGGGGGGSNSNIAAATAAANAPNNLINNPNGTDQMKLAHTAPKRTNYFKKVTSSSFNATDAVSKRNWRKQTKSIQLLNLFLRAIDSLAASVISAPPTGPLGQQQQQRSSFGGDFSTNTGGQLDFNSTGQLLFNQQSQRRQNCALPVPFESLKLQFEATFETLKQVYRSTQLVDGASQAADSRSLVLTVALHRRLLDQVALMRSELPQVCRLIGPAASSSSPSERNFWPSAQHRAQADAEERLQALLSRHSIPRLAEALADPLLKLEEFLLIYELLNDLVAFVGQKCRQSFVQRGKQLLNELTPLTGCPSISSSEEEDSSESISLPAPNQLASSIANLATYSNARAQFSAPGGPRLNSFSSGSQQALAAAKMNQSRNFGCGGGGGNGGGNQHRFSDYEAYERPVSSLGQQQQHPGTSIVVSRSPSRQIQLPTSINITAPSPMGSMRELHSSTGSIARVSADSQLIESQLKSYAGGSTTRLNQQQPAHPTQRYSVGNVCAASSITPPSARRKLPAQPINQHQQQLQDCSDDSMLAEMASQQLYLINDNQSDSNQDDQDEGGAERPPQDDKTRSKLIDELLKTINDDSFNEIVDFNNKFVASKGNNSSSGQLSAMELANSSRPKSAIDGGTHQTGSTSPRFGSISPVVGNNVQQQQAGNFTQRPTNLNIQPQQQQQPQQQGNRFDNVIRRMSTNFVQNFNKMSSTTLGNQQQQQQQQQQATNSSSTMATNTNNLNNQQQQFDPSLRREKSSASSYTTNNCLYVDNQIPARRHSDNTINVPRIQVALSSPQSAGSRTNLNQRATVSASKLANKWKLSAKSNQREASDKLSPNLSGALSYMRRHSSGNTTNGGNNSNNNSNSNQSEQNQSNGHVSNLFNLNASPFKTRSSSNLGLDFLISNRSMKRRCSAASMLGHQTQRKAENLLDAGMKSVQNMFG